MAQFASANPICYPNQPDPADKYLRTAKPPSPMPRTLHFDHHIHLRCIIPSLHITMVLAPPASTLAQAMVWLLGISHNHLLKS